MPFRRIFFWIHLAVGLIAGAFILSMSVTGMLLSFEPQITDWSERRVRSVETPAPDSPRIGLDAIVADARGEIPGAAPTEVKVWSDPAASVAVNMGKEKGSVFVNPYSGKITGKDSKTHVFLHKVEEWHRWLASKQVWKPVIDAVCLSFFFMVLSGLYLWWPRRWTRSVFKAASVPDFKLKGKARDWNWHNAFGLWAAPLLLVITLTGAIIGYRWAGDLVYVLTGNTPPPKPVEEKAGGMGKKGEKANLDSLFAQAQGVALGGSGKVPGWTSISLRLPQKPGAPVNVFIQEPGFWRRYTRSQLTLNAVTAEIVKWEPYSGYNLGRKLRMWTVPVHTGRALGIPGQLLAGFAAFAAGLLVWTGISQGIRRLSARLKIKRNWLPPPPTGVPAAGNNMTNPHRSGSH